MFFKKKEKKEGGFRNKSVDYSYSCQLFRPSYRCDLPSGLLHSHRVCRRSIRVLVMWRLDTRCLLLIYKLYLHIWCAFDLIYIFSGLLELSNFEDEILLKEGRNVTSEFSNSESRTQDDTLEVYYIDFTAWLPK